jgi:MFS transporter, DHA2 family, multidrug resistance protein
MQSIFGALLTAGYAAAMSEAIASSDKEVTDATQAQLTKSFDGADAVAAQHPEQADAIIAAAKTSFLQGDQWAYTAGIVAVLLGGAVIFFFFPRKEEEETLLAAYHTEDTRATPGPSEAPMEPEPLGADA